ncbi:MAG: hypothetical protein V2I25_05135, partial [Woeseiaceae bacterium]|nr:hypothetical protein [Woeseiaceae bacterium]
MQPNVSRSLLTLFVLAALAAIAAGNAPPAMAHDGEAELIDELIVLGRAERQIGDTMSASAGMVGFDDIRLP